MKKTIKLISSLVFALMLVCGMTVTSFADTSNVTYDGNAKQFIFTPGSEYSPTDLFTNFKGVMPGDQLKQTINVKNEASKKVTVDIYMKALGATELTKEDGIAEVSQADSADFLKEMNLTVQEVGYSQLFDAPADQTAGLTDWVCLGTFYSGANVDLDVTLDVPITMGNDFQERIGALDWQFKVVEKPIPVDQNGKPGKPGESGNATKTGDSMNLFPLIGIAAAALVIGLIVLFARKKKA